MVAERSGPRFPVSDHSEAARALQGLLDDRERVEKQARRKHLSARNHSRNVVNLHDSGREPDCADFNERRPTCGKDYRPGHALSLARAFDRSRWSMRSDTWMQLRLYR